MELKLKTPCEIVEANAGFHTELSIRTIGENVVEEELRWGVDSTITVPPLAETIAELVILEDNQIRYMFDQLLYFVLLPLCQITLFHQFIIVTNIFISS